MGKLVGGAALAVFLPIIVVVLAAGGMSTPNAAAGPAGALKPGAIPTQYIDLITRAAALCPLTTPALLAAQLHTESGFDPHASPAGIAGILPAEWHTYGRDDNGDGTADPHDPADAIPAMARIDCADAAAIARIPGDRTTLMLAAYNAGAGAVLQTGGVPPFPETQAYVKKVLGLAAAYTQPAAVTAHGPGATLAGQWAPGVAAVVNLVVTKFRISAGTYTNHHPDGGHAADLGYQQFGNDWTDGAPGIPGTGPQWQIATWIANNIVDTGNAWYVGHHASIHRYGDPPGLWRPINSQVGSTDPTYAHMNHIHLSWPPWYGQAGPDTFPPATNFSSPPQWTPGPLPAGLVLTAPFALRAGSRRSKRYRGAPAVRVRHRVWSATSNPAQFLSHGLCTNSSRHAVPHPHSRPRERHDHCVPAIAGRKRRQNVSTNVAIQARVPLHLREKAQRAAAALGVAMGAYLEQLMLRDQLDDSDKPAWAEDFYAQHPEFVETQDRPYDDAVSASQGMLLPV